VKDLSRLDAARDEFLAGTLDVGDSQQQALDRTGSGWREDENCFDVRAGTRRYIPVRLRFLPSFRGRFFSKMSALSLLSRFAEKGVSGSPLILSTSIRQGSGVDIICGVHFETIRFPFAVVIQNF
jgi:hypothetical protein